ncbi:MAG: ATP-binding protein [Verrucomicrobiota bacterium]
MPIYSHISIKKRLLLFLGLGFVILFIFFVLSLQYAERQKMENEIQNLIGQIEHALNWEIERNVVPMDGMLVEMKNDPKIIAAWMKKDRRQLADASKELFRRLHDFSGITHMYYLGLDQKCFLRVHNPSHYGDEIARYTFKEAVRTQKPFYGIELGKFGTFTLRVVHPWVEKGQVIGYVEVGREIDHFVPQIAHFLDVGIIMTLHKELLAKENWEEGVRVMGLSKKNWDFVPNHSVVVCSTDIPQEQLRDILATYHQHSSRRSPLHFFRHKHWGDAILVQTKWNKQTYMGGITALKDVSQKCVGETIVMRNMTRETANLNRLILQLSLACGMIGTLLLMFFNSQINQQERRLTRAREELFRAQESVEAANRAKSDFLAMMSHDIRTPMNAIIGFTNLLLETPLNDEQKDFLQTIRISGQTLLSLLNDILDYTKIEAGKFQLEQKPFNPVEEAGNIVKLQTPVAHVKGITLTCEIAANIPQMMRGDKTRFSQILNNLVSNALKFTDKGGVKIIMEIIKDDQDSHLRVAVKDTGIGIPAGKFDHLFKPFTQLENDAGKRQGTGLGLAISRRLCELMGGDIWAESQVGVGTTFIFTLPIIEATEKENVKISFAQPTLDLTKKLAETRPLKILLAEDNVVNQKLAVVLLKRMGYEPKLVDNGKKVLDALKQETFDIVLMDIQMPEMDGMEATQRIRVGEGGEENKKIFVCAISALAMQGDREKCLGAGMNDYISKPLQFQELGTILSRLSEKLGKARKA